jgi:hypothetical protein
MVIALPYYPITALNKNHETNNTYHPHIILPPHRRVFYSSHFPGEIRAGLTKVNKHVLNGSNTINYNDTIFPTVKPAPTTVNKMQGLLTRLTYYPINALADYRIAAFTNCHIIKLSLPP